jgi:hypothetical protein
MAQLLFRCPATGMMVQGWHADDGSATDADHAYVGVPCLACKQLHLVNPETGRVVGGDNEE